MYPCLTILPAPPLTHPGISVTAHQSFHAAILQADRSDGRTFTVSHKHGVQSFTGRHHQARGLGEGCLVRVTVVAVLLIPTPRHTHTAASTVLSETIVYLVNMPDRIRITSGSAQKRWPEADSMILAYRLASRPDPFGLKQSAGAKLDLGGFCKV